MHKGHCAPQAWPVCHEKALRVATRYNRIVDCFAVVVRRQDLPLYTGVAPGKRACFSLHAARCQNVLVRDKNRDSHVIRARAAQCVLRASAEIVLGPHWGRATCLEALWPCSHSSTARADHAGLSLFIVDRPSSWPSGSTSLFGPIITRAGITR